MQTDGVFWFRDTFPKIKYCLWLALETFVGGKGKGTRGHGATFLSESLPSYAVRKTNVILKIWSQSFPFPLFSKVDIMYVIDNNF